MSSSNTHAWITAEEETFLVSVPTGSGRSAILELIEQIYTTESLRSVSRARHLLREWIHSTSPATLTEREAVKVTAKRLRAPTDRHLPTQKTTPLTLAPPLPSFEVPDLAPGKRVERVEIVRWLERLKKQTNQATTKWTSDRTVAALLLDSAGHVITYAWNTNAVIRTRHAEWNLCETLSARVPGGKIPVGATLYVSLKPCRMCAARIWECAADPAKLNVIYLENDPGPLAQGTLLDPRSPARVRYLGMDHPLFSTVVSRLDPTASTSA